MPFNITLPMLGYEHFLTPEPVAITSPASGATVRNVPLPLAGVRFDLAAMGGTDARALGADLALARADEVIAELNDGVADLPGLPSLTVSAHIGYEVSIGPWPTGTAIPQGKYVSIQRAGRWYLCQTRGSSGTGTTTAVLAVLFTRLTFQAGDVVSWRPRIQGWLTADRTGAFDINGVQRPGSGTITEAR
jgi:hypothetical protein